jgi:AraC-like DNA-binding protein/quercetin dioxygenase-like cupin family protein
MITMSLGTVRYERDRPGQKELWTARETFDRRTGLDIHAHAGVEVGLVLTGQERIQFSGLDTIYGQGEVWLCNAWEPHGWQIVMPRTQIVVLDFSVHFLGNEMIGDMPWLSLFAAPPQMRPRATSPGLRQLVLGIGHSLSRAIGQEDEFSEQSVRLDVLRLFIQLVRHWERRHLVGVGDAFRPVDAHGLARLMPALAAVHASPTRNMPLADVAAVCGLSVSRFRALFRQTTGISFTRFCLRTRVARAAHMLLHTDHPVTAVAQQMGFTDASHLHHRFLEQYGCTPRQFRLRRGTHPADLPTASGTEEEQQDSPPSVASRW